MTGHMMRNSCRSSIHTSLWRVSNFVAERMHSICSWPSTTVCSNRREEEGSR